MRKDNNVIDNENVGTTHIDNVNERYRRARKVEILAAEIKKKLGAADSSWAFLCKVAMKLSESRIWQHVETALKGNNPMGLFIFLCKRDGV